MHTYSDRIQAFALASAALAGFVDAIAFIELGGFFVSFMSGNSTRLAVGVAYHVRDALTAGGLIACFVAGVVGGCSLGGSGGARTRVMRMALVCGLLVLAALTGEAHLSLASGAILAFAMGALNAVLEENGESRVGLTYMTGALVRFGQRLALSLRGGGRWGWLPYLLLWSCLAAGAILGAVAYEHVGVRALWAAAVVAAGLTIPLREGPQA